LQTVIPVIEHLDEYLNIVPEHNNMRKLPVINLDKKQPFIIFNKVCLNIEKAGSILKNIDFVCEGNGLFGLFGPSGCGKSTILKLLM